MAPLSPRGRTSRTGSRASASQKAPSMASRTQKEVPTAFEETAMVSKSSFYPPIFLLMYSHLVCNKVAQTWQPVRHEWQRTLPSSLLWVTHSFCTLTCISKEPCDRKAVDCVSPVTSESHTQQYWQCICCQVPANLLACTITITLRFPFTNEGATPRC